MRTRVLLLARSATVAATPAIAFTPSARTFATPGEYAFNCHIHPGMRGGVTVVAPDTL
jgi:plastocyanin